VHRVIEVESSFESRRRSMVLLRQELGELLRETRRDQGRTLREVSAAANVSLGYLSELERGTKEASSELLQSVSLALGLQLSELLVDLTERVARAEAMTQPVPLPVAAVSRVARVAATRRSAA